MAPVVAERGIDISKDFPKPWTDEVVRTAGVVVTTGLAFTPDGRQLAISDGVGRVDFWDVGLARAAGRICASIATGSAVSSGTATCGAGPGAFGAAEAVVRAFDLGDRE